MRFDKCNTKKHVRRKTCEEKKQARKKIILIYLK